MNLFEKLYSLIILFSVLIGLIIGQIQAIQAHVELFIVPLLVAMLFITFLQIPLEDVVTSVKNITFTLTSVTINFIWTPLFAWALASIFLFEHPALYIGFIMLLVTPCTDWYLIFTSIAKGNVALSTAILPLNLLLQVILLPLYLLFFAGATGAIELSFLFESILIVLILPLALAIIMKFLFKKNKQLFSKFSGLPILFLSLAIVAMFASQGNVLLENLEIMWMLILPLALFFVINFFLSQKVGDQLQFTTQDKKSLTLTTLARNSPLALAIAMTAFPDQPLIPLVLVIGPLLELPILAMTTQVLLVFSKKADKK